MTVGRALVVLTLWMGRNVVQWPSPLTFWPQNVITSLLS